jgi:hypothetical protein
MTRAACCLKCEGPIPAERRADSRYCDESCKLAATYERKRLQTRLAELERGLSTARMYRFPQQQVTRIAREVDRAEARLKLLLGG